MNISLFKKNKKQFSTLPTMQGTTVHRIGRDQYFDWAAMFTITTIIVVGLIAWGAYAYFDIESRLLNASTLDTAKKPETVNEQVLGRIIDRYTARADERAILLKGYGGFGDPSI